MAIAIIFLILSTTVIILNTTYNELRRTQYFFLKYAISFSSLLCIVVGISVYYSHLKFYNVIL